MNERVCEPSPKTVRGSFRSAWRTKVADYPRINADLPDYNPRGCQKGGCFTEYVYSPQRLRYPLIRTGERGEGKWRRATWDEALTMVAEKNNRP